MSDDEVVVRIAVDDDGTVRPLRTPGDDAAQAAVTQAIMNSLTREASEEIMTYIKLGKVVDGLARELDTSGLGPFGLGMKTLLDQRSGKPSGAQGEKTMEKLVRFWVDAIYKAAEVER